MEITKDMIEAYAKHYSIDLTDGTQEAGIVGSLTDWAEGKGELDAALVNGNPVFVPIVEAYYKAKGEEVPETVNAPLTPVAEKSPEATSENT